MTEDYEVKKESAFLRITDSRPVTDETIQQFCEEIPELARASGVSRILVDHRDIQNTLSTMDRYRYATEIAKHFRGLKIAFVQDAPLHDPQKFGETVAVNLGANIRLFTTLDEAYDWLEVEPANKPDAGDGKQPRLIGIVGHFYRLLYCEVGESKIVFEFVLGGNTS